MNPKEKAVAQGVVLNILINVLAHEERDILTRSGYILGCRILAIRQVAGVQPQTVLIIKLAHIYDGEEAQKSFLLMLMRELNHFGKLVAKVKIDDTTEDEAALLLNFRSVAETKSFLKTHIE